MEYTTIDCCPVDTRLAPHLIQIKQATGCVYQSVYRGLDPNAQKYLTGAAPCYKHNQAWIYANYPPGVANPPGYSTHECKNDGVAYTAWLRGASIPWWCCGIDVDDAHVAAVCAEAQKLGWIVTITYPGSSVEYHHVNFRKNPGIKKLIPVLKHGSKGPRVTALTKKLAFIERPNKPGVTYMNQTTNNFNHNVEDAVKLFQSDHHQVADGIVGSHTRAQLKVAARNERRRHKIDDLQKKYASALNAEAAAKKRAETARGEDLKKFNAEVKHQHQRASKLADEIRKLGGKPDDTHPHD